MTEARYTLTLSETQAGVLIRALDLFSRIHMGQLDGVADNAAAAYTKVRGMDWATVDQVRSLMRNAEGLVGPPSGGYYGIAHPKVHEEARIACDIKQVVRHRLAWDREPNGGIYVDFDTPMKLSAQPLPTIERKEGGEGG